MPLKIFSKGARKKNQHSDVPRAVGHGKYTRKGLAAAADQNSQRSGANAAADGNARGGQDTLGRSQVHEKSVDGPPSGSGSFVSASSASLASTGTGVYDDADPRAVQTRRGGGVCLKCQELRCDAVRPASLALPRNGHLPSDLARTGSEVTSSADHRSSLAGSQLVYGSSSCDCCALGHKQPLAGRSSLRYVPPQSQGRSPSGMRGSFSLTRVSPAVSAQAEAGFSTRAMTAAAVRKEKYLSTPSLNRQEQMRISDPHFRQPPQQPPSQLQETPPQQQIQEQASTASVASVVSVASVAERRHSVETSEVLSAYNESKDFGSNASTLQSSSGGAIRTTELESSMTLNREDTPQGDGAQAEVDLSTLPPGWEAAYASCGRIYYIDHVNGKTHWLHPGVLEQQGAQVVPDGWERVESLDYGVYYVNHIKGTTWRPNPALIPQAINPSAIQSPLLASPQASSTPSSQSSYQSPVPQHQMEQLSLQQKAVSSQQLPLVTQQVAPGVQPFPSAGSGLSSQQQPLHLSQLQLQQQQQLKQAQLPAQLPASASALAAQQAGLSSASFNRSQQGRHSSRSVESGRTQISLGSLSSAGGVMAALHARRSSHDSSESPSGLRQVRRYSHDNGLDSGGGMMDSQSPTLSRHSSSRWSQRRHISTGDAEAFENRFQQQRKMQSSAPVSRDSSPNGTFIRNSSRRYADHPMGSAESSPAGMLSRHSSRRYGPRATYVPPNPHLTQEIPDWLTKYARGPGGSQTDHLQWETSELGQLEGWLVMLRKLFREDLKTIVMHYEDNRHAMRQELLHREYGDDAHEMQFVASQSDPLDDQRFRPAPPGIGAQHSKTVHAIPPSERPKHVLHHQVSAPTPPTQPTGQYQVTPYQQGESCFMPNQAPPKMMPQPASSSSLEPFANRHQLSADSGSKSSAMDRKISSSSLPEEVLSSRQQPFMQIQLTQPFKQFEELHAGERGAVDPRIADISDSGGDLGSFSGASLPSTASPSIGRQSSASGSSSANNLLSDQSPTVDKDSPSVDRVATMPPNAPVPFAAIQLREPLRTESLDDPTLISNWSASSNSGSNAHQMSRSTGGSDDSSHHLYHTQMHQVRHTDSRSLASHTDSRSLASQGSIDTGRYIPGEVRSHHSLQNSASSADMLSSGNIALTKPTALSILANDARRPSLSTDSPMAHPDLPLSLVQQRDAIYGQNTEYV